MRGDDRETRADEVFLMKSQLSKLQLLTTALKQENARLAEENKVLKRALAANAHGLQPPYSTTTIHASQDAAGHSSSQTQGNSPANAEAMDYIEGEIMAMQDALYKTRLKLQQAEAAQGQQGGVSPVRRSSQSLPHQHQRRVAASPVNRRLLRHSSPSRAPACSPSPGRLQYKNMACGKLVHSPSPSRHQDMKQRSISRGRQAGQRRAINSKTINLLHSGLPTVLSSRAQL